MPIELTLAKEAPADVPVFAVPVFAGNEVPVGSPVELDLDFLEAQGFSGKSGQTQALMAEDGSTILAVGVGERDKVTLDGVRRAAAAAVRASWKADGLATNLLDAVPDSLDRGKAAQAVAEGALLAAYRFTRYKGEGEPCAIEAITVVGKGGAAVQKGLDRGAAVAQGVYLARDLVNTPARDLDPKGMADAARDLASRLEGVSVEVLDEKQAAEQGLGGLLGVGGGSDTPPRLIKLRYDPPGARATVAVVGKGITFDSGGLSIKTGEGMMTMKTDMSGAAAVLGVFAALPALAPKVRVLGYAACAENMPSGRAMRPGDVLTIRNGKTVEVLNTDAEGRLVLADALSLAVEEEPDAIVDLATLTGACVVALGREIGGLMGNHDDLVEQVGAAADVAGEPMWHLPLPDRYRKHIDSEIADIKNIGAAGQAGTLSAGLFLKEFVGEVPWVHLDIAGPARAEGDDAYIAKGGTGVGVRTVLELLSSFRKPARRG